MYLEKIIRVVILLEIRYNYNCEKAFGILRKGGARMNFNFDWNYVSAGAPYVTVSELGLAFNGPAINMLKNPEDVVVGFDEAKLTIGIKSAENMENVKSYKFYSRINNGWVRIGCKDFVRYLSAISGIKFSPAKKFIAKMDQEQQILYITINSEEVEEDHKTE